MDTCPDCQCSKNPATGEQLHFVTCPKHAEWVKQRHAKRRRKISRKEKDDLMASLGLTKVRGAVSGKIYYE